MNPNEPTPVPPAPSIVLVPPVGDAVVFPPTLPLATSASPPDKPAHGTAEDLCQEVRALICRVPVASAGKWLLTVNPFYLASAVMMLYGLYLVSVDTQLLGQETSQLAFNFSSLQLYECLLVVTAVVLAGFLRFIASLARRSKAASLVEERA